MAASKNFFEQQIAQQSAAASQHTEWQRKKAEAKKNIGTTSIGTKKGTATAFKTLFEAKAEGHDVELFDRKGGWERTQYSGGFSGEGKYEGGPAGVAARVIVKEQPRGPPPKRGVHDLK